MTPGFHTCASRSFTKDGQESVTEDMPRLSISDVATFGMHQINIAEKQERKIKPFIDGFPKF